MTGAPAADVTVRPVEPPEYEALGAMTRDVYIELLGDTIDADYRLVLADVAARAEVAEVLVAVDGEGRVLGGVTYVPGPDNPYAEFTGEDEVGVRMLVVDPAAQRRRVGTRLMEACLDRARAAGKARVSLHTAVALDGAQRLYEGMGFRRAPERDWWPEPDVLLMGYVLDLGT